MSAKPVKNYLDQSFIVENNIIKGKKINFDIKEDNVGKLIIDKCNAQSEKVAQIDVETGRHITYGEMKENSIRCALWLQKQGIGYGDVVVVCTYNQMDAYIPCLASFYVGAIYNPWFHEITLKNAQYQMNLTMPKIIFCCENVADILHEAAKLEKLNVKIIVIGEHSKTESLKDILNLQTYSEVKTYMPRATEKSSIGIILFSSGTTGLSKGVQHSYGVIFKLLYIISTLPTENSVTLWYSSLYWMSGSMLMLITIVKGSTRILHKDFDPEQACKIIEKFKVDWIFLPPSSITYLYKSNILKKYSMNSLRNILRGGGRLTRDISMDLRKLLPHVTVINGYGITEVFGYVCVSPEKCKNIDSIGYVAPNTEIKIIDAETKETLGPNVSGELCIKNSAVMIGYLKNPTATKQAIDEEGWFRTGDIAYYEENGEIIIVDRLKEIMKFQGHQISPFEIEELLLSHPDVIEAAVVPAPHDLDIERPMAFVKKVSESKVSEQELVELSSTLDKYKTLCGGVVFLDQIPHTSSGKIHRFKLKEIVKSYKC